MEIVVPELTQVLVPWVGDVVPPPEGLAAKLTWYCVMKVTVWDVWVGTLMEPAAAVAA